MKVFFLLFTCSTIIINFGTSDDDKAWKSFMNTYSKTYPNLETEEARKTIFNNNAEMIKKHNEKYAEGSVTFNMGMNKFGDLTHDEFLQQFSTKHSRCNKNLTNKDENFDTVNDVNVPDDYDAEDAPKECQWKEPEAVTTVKDQGNCTSGWAYSGIDAIAGRYYVHNNKNACQSLSIPYLIQCSSGMHCCGCKGGEAIKVCELAKLTQKMPDTSFKNDTCKLDLIKGTVSLEIKRCQTKSPSKELNNVPKNLCEKGPMSAYISAEQPSFQFAKEGIYYEDKCDSTPNHEVLLVGYNGTDKNNSYWIIKNSFGKSWGDEGFLKISTKRNKAGCRIIDKVSYPEF